MKTYITNILECVRSDSKRNTFCHSFLLYVLQARSQFTLVNTKIYTSIKTHAKLEKKQGNVAYLLGVFVLNIVYNVAIVIAAKLLQFLHCCSFTDNKSQTHKL